MFARSAGQTKYFENISHLNIAIVYTYMVFETHTFICLKNRHHLTLNGVSLRGIFCGGKCQVKAKIYQVISQKGPPDTYGATFNIKTR